MIVDDWIDLTRYSKKNRELKDKMLKHVPEKDDQDRLARMNYRQIELESARYREYLPLKEYTW